MYSSTLPEGGSRHQAGDEELKISSIAYTEPGTECAPLIAFAKALTILAQVGE